MDHEVNTRNNALKRRLEDGSAEPMDLPLSLLEDITNCFSDDRQIGRGGFAIVYKGIVGHRMVAVKKLSNTFDLEETKFHKEVECLVKARHKNIVRFLGYCAETQGQIADFEGKFVMADTRNWLLCFEYVTNGSLDKYITDASHGLEWGKRFEIIKGICEGLCYLHDKRILHLDLKPANILIADHMVPKIADFGLSRCLDEAQTRLFTSRLCGSVGYLAPEFFRGQVAFASDIYSLGVVIVEILTGEKGYPEDKSVVESWMDRLKGETQLEQVRVCTKIGIECMELDPNKRPAVRHIIDRLQKTSSIVKSGIHSSLGEQEVFLLKKQHNDEKIGNTFAAEIEGVAKCQEKEDQLSLWELQDTEQDQTIIPSDDSSVSQKLSNLDIDKSGSRRKNRKSNYMRYGGPTVRKSNSVKIFREKELKPILDIGKLIGRGSFGDVYEGILGNRLVAVRKPIAGSLLLGEDFANEVIKRSQVIHNNILRLIGCCLEGDIPMLVYELLSNGSLLDIVEIMSEVHVDLGVRLRIAAQAADGLAYMHSESNNRTLFGCGLAAENILLDDNFVAKISDFGRLMRREATGLDSFIGRPTRNPSDYFIGRPGPCNEVYSSDQPAASNKETQQIDIYSFGVIILQLISTKKATSVNVDNLVTYFLKCQKNGKKATEMFDKEIAITRDLAILDSLAEIAVECIRTEGLSTDVDARPKMTEVAERILILSRTYTG